MPSHPANGLRNKIWLAFILQVAAISFATVLGVYGASAIVKDVLIQRALANEANYYWQRLQNNPAAPLPDTHAMKAFLLPPGQSNDSIPVYLRALQPGYHSLPQVLDGLLVLVSDDPRSGRLFLVFNQQQVDALVLFFGAIPLIVVLLAIYLIAFFTYYLSRRAVSPVIWLANIVQGWDPKQPDVAALDPAKLPVDVGGEVQVLAHALHDFASRIAAFVERERNFTRFASHELRSPLTVIRIACDVLPEEGIDPYVARSLHQIKAAARDMEALIESFLILAREADSALPEEDFVVNDVAREEVEKARALVAEKPVELRIEEPYRFALHASPRILSVVLGNLLRNACNYTDAGSVVVHVGADSIAVEDTGIGMSHEELDHAFELFYRGNHLRSGQGMGLAIVKRLSHRFGWPVEIASAPGRGTRATVRFPHPQPVDG